MADDKTRKALGSARVALLHRADDAMTAAALQDIDDALQAPLGAPLKSPPEMTDDEAARMHAALAGYHERLAKGAILDAIHEYHADLAERFANEVKRIPERVEARRRADERHKGDDT